MTPTASTVGGVDFVGGPGLQGGGNAIDISNISLTDNGKNYYGAYLNDDWKVTPKLTVNLGLRWDFFGLVFEHHGNQANFVPSGPPLGGPVYLIPPGPNAGNLSSGCPHVSQTWRQRMASRLTSRMLMAKGWGIRKIIILPRGSVLPIKSRPSWLPGVDLVCFYNGFENRGFSPNLGENYPFQFNFQFKTQDDNHPIVYNGCTAPERAPSEMQPSKLGLPARRSIRCWSMPRVGIAGNSV